MKMSEGTYEERAARGARTQSLFRDMNERVREINDAFSSAVPLGEWICECVDDACSKQVSVLLPEYEEVRSNPRRFVIFPDESHLLSEIEAVVQKDERYWVVEKAGKAGDLAAKVDPRRVGLLGQRADAA
jgi:hypothetical protein